MGCLKVRDVFILNIVHYMIFDGGGWYKCTGCVLKS